MGSDEEEEVDARVERDRVVDGPDVVEHELDEQGLELLAALLHLLAAEDALRLGVEVPLAPQAPAERLLAQAELGRVQLGEARDAERPAVDRRREDDVALRRVEVERRVVALLVRLVARGGGGGGGAVRPGGVVRVLGGLGALSSAQVLLHALGRVERADDGVDVLDDAVQVVVRLDRRQLDLGDEAVELVDATGRRSAGR